MSGNTRVGLARLRIPRGLQVPGGRGPPGFCRFDLDLPLKRALSPSHPGRPSAPAQPRSRPFLFASSCPEVQPPAPQLGLEGSQPLLPPSPRLGRAAFPLSSERPYHRSRPSLGLPSRRLASIVPREGPWQTGHRHQSTTEPVSCHLPLPDRPPFLSASSSLDQTPCPLLAPPPFPPEKALWWVSLPWPPNVPASAR